MTKTQRKLPIDQIFQQCFQQLEKHSQQYLYLGTNLMFQKDNFKRTESRNCFNYCLNINLLLNYSSTNKDILTGSL